MTVMVKSCLFDLYASFSILKNVVVNRLTCVASHQVTLMRSASSLVCSPIRLKCYKAHLCGLEDVTFVVCVGLTVLCFNTDRRFSGKKYRTWGQLCKYILKKQSIQPGML